MSKTIKMAVMEIVVALSVAMVTKVSSVARSASVGEEKAHAMIVARGVERMDRLGATKPPTRDRTSVRRRRRIKH